MTPERFLDCLTTIEWTKRGFASIIDVDEREVRRWGKGIYKIPESVAAWLEKLATFHEQNPPPPKPRRVSNRQDLQDLEEAPAASGEIF